MSDDDPEVGSGESEEPELGSRESEVEEVLQPPTPDLPLPTPQPAIIDINAPAGLQHCEQPQTWLKSTLLPIVTLTGSVVHLHVNVPPAKLESPALTPLSTEG